MTLRLTELPALTGDTTATVTTGSPFNWYGVDYYAPATPTHTYTSRVAPYCDSIVTLTINEVDALVGDTTAYYCYGESFEWHGVSYHEGDRPTHKYTSTVPPYLDSIVTLKLIERPNLARDTFASYCQGNPYEWYGQPYTIHDPAPTHTFTSKQYPECDSIVTLKLTELPKPEIYNILNTTTSVIGCDGTTYDLSVMFEYINLDGTLIVDLDGMVITPDFVRNSNLPQTAIAKFEGLTADGATHTLTVKTIGGSYSCEASSNIEAPQDAKIELIAKAAVQPYACGDHTYSVNVHVEFANGQGRDLIIEDWKGNKQVFQTMPSDIKIDDPIFTYEKHIVGGRHGYKVYFDGNDNCAAYAYFTEPAQPKIDNVQPDIASVTGCDGTTYNLTVTFDYYNQDGMLSVDLDGIAADDITPDFVPDIFDKQTATAIFKGLTADGLTHTLTVKTTGGVHNCEKSIPIVAPQDEAIITSVEVTNVPENILCDQTEYDAIVTATQTSDNAIGKKIFIVHEGKTDDFVVTASPMVVTVKMTTVDATGLTMDAYFEGHPECKVTSDAFDTPKRLSCVKDYEQKCEGEIYTWPVTNLTYGPFTKAGIDTIVNTHNIHDTLIISVFPTYDMPAKDTTIIDGETYTWNGKDYETAGVYTETLETVNGCDSIVTLNLTVKENIVENIAFTIAEQCAGEGALEIEVQHTGHLTDARLTFSPEAVAAGFENGTYPIENDVVTVPYNVKAGIFSVNIDLLFHNRLKHSANKQFTLLFPSSVLEQGWMDAIFVLTHDYNGGYDFTDFQWYKKGQLLVGETGPYLYQPLEVGAEYSAMLTELSGLKLMTCPIIITDQTDITLYPTIVTKREMIRVTVSQNAVLTLYSLMGAKVCTYSLRHGETQITVPGTQGIYFAEVVLDSGKRKVFKIMAR